MGAVGAVGGGVALVTLVLPCVPGRAQSVLLRMAVAGWSRWRASGNAGDDQPDEPEVFSVSDWVSSPDVAPSRWRENSSAESVVQLRGSRRPETFSPRYREREFGA